MHISILTLFPEMFIGPFQSSIVKRAQEKGSLSLSYINIRDYGIGKHNIVDDTPYGGGAGMVLRVDVIDTALKATKEQYRKKNKKNPTEKTILLDARGKLFTQRTVENYSQLDHLILIAGHYEGVDERVRLYLVDEIVSLGNFVLTGGEIPAMAIVDSVTRLIPNVIKTQSHTEESFAIHKDTTVLVEHPHYTKPQEYKGHTVPDILLQGNHAAINTWRQEQAEKETKQSRPDLLTQDS